MHKIIAIFLVIFIYITTATYSLAEDVTPNIIVSEVKEDSVLLNLEMIVKDGWYFYYKDPGDLGIGLSITIDQEHKVFWPAYTVNEQIIGDMKLRSNIYNKSTIFPIEVFNLKHNSSIEVTIDFAKCDGTICMPMHETINVDV